MSARSGFAVLRNQRGITLVEVVIVGILAAIVMVALTGFYINSQGTWIDGSSQAVTQRDLTFVVTTISDSVHASYAADVSVPQRLILYEADGTTEKCRFWLASDSLIHEGKVTVDRGPLGQSRATRFDVTSDTVMVKLRNIELRSANGRLIGISTNAAFYNR